MASSEDIVQDLFTKLWQRKDSLDHIDNIQAYLRRSAANSSLNYLKKNQKISYTDDWSAHESTEVHEPQPDTVDELRKLIHLTIDQLPDRCRLVFIMSRYDRMSYKEIASQLDISIKTVENQISKALKVLRKVVGNERKVK